MSFCALFLYTKESLSKEKAYIFYYSKHDVETLFAVFYCILLFISIVVMVYGVSDLPEPAPVQKRPIRVEKRRGRCGDC
ncbi:hypothetical protein PFISCL1PPCAC_5358 [Pristionchus fissidentatus]|uniref:Uncharacterized protein n=1 Tax=Pristionchus fissidentatus TaxID=1538716 RepID=A0AAV5V5P1_9BILA|nr:hypothetical protein PFISCL1PPCAC_5358 [Pristionchus fissidentatus]